MKAEIGILPIALAIALAAPANATTLQDLFGLGLGRSTRRQPARSPATELTPMTPEGMNWTLYQGGGINERGFLRTPPTVHSVYGINSLRDGYYEQPLLTEGNRVSITATRLRDGTVYYPRPVNSYRVMQNNQPVFYQFDPKRSSVRLTVTSNRIQSISFCYYRGENQVCR